MRKSFLFSSLLVLASLFLSCSFLEEEKTASVTFTLNPAALARAIDSEEQKKEEQPESYEVQTPPVYIDVELLSNTDYSAKEQIIYEPPKEPYPEAPNGEYDPEFEQKIKEYEEQIEAEFREKLRVTFDEVPVGTEVYANVQIYQEYEGQQFPLYTGTSAPKVIETGKNTLEVQLEYAKIPEPEHPDEPEDPYKPEYPEDPHEKDPYEKPEWPEEPEKKEQKVFEEERTYTVVNPIFYDEYTNTLFDKGEISYNYENNVEKAFWKFNGLSDYQKIRITYKGIKLKEDEENIIAFKLALNDAYYENGDHKTYNFDLRPVIDEPDTYEILIPQGKGIDLLIIENKWDVEKGDWQNDFSYSIESIELIRDPDILASYWAPEYIDERPEVLGIINTTMWSQKGSITYHSKEGKANGGSGYAAGYYEFDRLGEYDKAFITFSAYAPENVPVPQKFAFVVKGYSPYYNIEEPDVEFHSINNTYIELEPYPGERKSLPYTASINLTKLRTRHPDSASHTSDFIPTALEFENCNYDGYWDENGDDNINWGDDWTLVIEKVILTKADELMPDLTIFDPNNDSDIQNLQIDNGGTAPERPVTVLRNGEKYLKVTPNGFGLQIFLPRTPVLSQYLTVMAEIYTDENDSTHDVSLLLRLRDMPQELLPPDFQQRVSEDLRSPVTSTEVTLVSGDILGCGKVNHLTAFITDKQGTAFNDKPVYIGRIIATNKRDPNYNPFIKYQVPITITVIDDTNTPDINVTLSGATLAADGSYTTSETSIGLTATPGYDSYIWKVNGVVQTTGVAGNTFALDMSTLPEGENDIVLLASKDGEYYSWHAQIRKN